MKFAGSDVQNHEFFNKESHPTMQSDQVTEFTGRVPNQ
jgi:hypothetical protein